MNKLRTYDTFYATESGICIHNLIICKSSTHRYVFHVIKQYFKALKQFIIAKYSRTGTIIELDSNEIYLIAHHPWFNYFHWLCESIPRLLNVQENQKELTLIIPDYIIQESYVKESLAIFTFKAIYVNDGHVLKVPKGIISPIESYSYVFNKKSICSIKNLYRTHFGIFLNNSPFRKIYVTRQNATRRKFKNEQEIILLCQSFGFEIIHLESTTFEYQVKLFSETACLVSIHGAALTNMLFMSESAKVIELYRRKNYIFEHKSKVYQNLALALNIKHHEIACDPINKKDDFFTGDLFANIKELEQILKND